MARSAFYFGTKFLDCLISLPRDVLPKLNKCLDLLSKNPQHPSLHIEKLHGIENLYSVRVDQKYRLVFAQRPGEAIQLLFVGMHDNPYRDAKRTGAPQVLKDVQLADIPFRMGNVEPSAMLLSIKTHKYLPLSKHLMSQPQFMGRVEMTFEEVQRVIGDLLPPSAHRYSAWWANDHTRHVQASAWLGVGWRTEKVRIAERSVCFVRVA